MVVNVHMLLILFVLVVMIILRGCAKQVVVEGGGVVGLLVGEELTKEARLYKMLITPTTKALVVFWKRPRKAGEPKWFTKGPRQFTGHLTASPRQASTNCVFRKRQLGRGVISQTYLSVTCTGNTLERLL